MAYSSLVERAMRFAADRHREQCRKGTSIPYLTHPAGVALLLARCGFDDEVLAAALLHDVLEDTGVTADELAEAFTDRVATLVVAASEQKCGPDGRKLAWQTRKDEHLARLPQIPVEARAIVFADKLHNLGTILDDAAVEPDVWNRFNSDSARQAWYYQAVFDAVGDDPELAGLRSDYAGMLRRLRASLPNAGGDATTP